MHNKPILLVEDNPDDEALTKRAIAKAKISNPLVVVRDGAEALDYLFCTGAFAQRDKTINPQIVLLDLKLPKVDGLQVLQRIRADERTKYLPVVLLTSSAEEKDRTQGYHGGANSYIVKPVNPQDFDKCIQQLGLYWVILNEPLPG